MILPMPRDREEKFGSVLTSTLQRKIRRAISQKTPKELREIMCNIGWREVYLTEENGFNKRDVTRIGNTQQELQKLLNPTSKPYSDEPEKIIGTSEEITRRIMMTLYFIGVITERISSSSVIKKGVVDNQKVIERELINGGNVSVFKSVLQYNVARSEYQKEFRGSINAYRGTITDISLMSNSMNVYRR